MARPRNFDEVQAIHSAMSLFWKHGFQKVSLDELDHATGLSRSSLYNTFGDKLGLFCRALDAYRDGPCIELARPFRQEQGAAALAGYLKGLSVFLRSPLASNGCLMVCTDLEGPSDKAVASKLQLHFDGLRRDFEGAYREGLRNGNVNPSIRPKAAANWLQVFARGLMAGAASGEASAVLQSSIRTTADHLSLRL